MIAAPANELYARLRPLPPLRSQLVYGALNPDNVLMTDGCVPVFIDFAPFWAPVEFAVAMFANWIGPWIGRHNGSSCVEHDPHFAQLLLRASIRMLLIVSELGRVDHWGTERRAAELVLSWVDHDAG